MLLFTAPCLAFFVSVEATTILTQGVFERWAHPIQNWSLTLSKLAIHFPERLEKYISL
ncbi:hypothetical protein [Microbulbifer thermotolerans]|uniref:hypothetical protein n=1 Tax=Microbulbifer thermotolerans TaxID=252514 RepID=UPI003969DD68